MVWTAHNSAQLQKKTRGISFVPWLLTILQILLIENTRPARLSNTSKIPEELLANNTNTHESGYCYAHFEFFSAYTSTHKLPPEAFCRRSSDLRLKSLWKSATLKLAAGGEPIGHIARTWVPKYIASCWHYTS